jgi:hypothetical protein
VDQAIKQRALIPTSSGVRYNRTNEIPQAANCVLRYVPIHERYDKNSDLLAAVFFKPPDTFRVACFEKLTGTPQWAGLWWTERRPDSIFSEEVEAVAFAEKLLAEK